MVLELKNAISELETALLHMKKTKLLASLAPAEVRN
jgi:hypothetical protein